jgi:hypothetical protein
VRARDRRGGGPVPPPLVVSLHARASTHATFRADATTRSCHLHFQLGYSGCERARAILHRPNDRRRFPLRGKEKGPGVLPGPWMSERLIAVATEGSLLSSAGPGGTYATAAPGNTHAYPRSSSSRLSAFRTAVLLASRWLSTSWRHESNRSRRALQAPSRFCVGVQRK